MLIIDAHLDLGWNALQWNRDLRLSTYTLRSQEAHQSGPGRGQGTTALPELRKGRIALCFSTLLARSTGRATPHVDYASAVQAFGAARGQLAYYRALEREGLIRIISQLTDLERHMAEWQQWDADPKSDENAMPPLGFLISMESADPILSPGELEEWQAEGVRVIGPAHYGPGRYAGGTGTEMGLTPEGREFIAEMQRLGILLDTTHLSDQAFWEALELYQGPILASHNNCRTLVPHQRQFDDEQLKAIIERDGVIGMAFDIWMMQPNWTLNTGVKLAKIVEHIDHICQIAGSSRHIGIGSDLDGGFGREQSPCDLDTIADLQQLTGLLADRGYKDEDIAGIMHGNWLRLLRQAWKSS
ncbi:peptidase [Dictyobacter sp. S3.2.2.5]|uniref:Peptidase n=1 Tax=Dictyobacter halimunensis TaxID=3026934 RepID=A0ABQ6FNB0_9CHLR|nr:peptidase [Dictyobacter sp. S3.2.2.5]